MTSKRIKALKVRVENILQTIPESRNSDITLMIAVWKKYYPYLVRTGKAGQQGVWLVDLYDLPREDNVKRIRAYFQNDLKKYPPTSWEVAKERKWKKAEWDDAISKGFLPL